jgi:hypothetical protein
VGKNPTSFLAQEIFSVTDFIEPGQGLEMILIGFSDQSV